MSFIPWRTVALCAATAVLAGAGSAAIAADDEPVPAKAGEQVPVAEAIARKCAYAREHDPEVAAEVCALKPADVTVAKRVGGPCAKTAGKPEFTDKQEFRKSAAPKPAPPEGTGVGAS